MNHSAVAGQVGGLRVLRRRAPPAARRRRRSPAAGRRARRPAPGSASSAPSGSGRMHEVVAGAVALGELHAPIIARRVGDHPQRGRRHQVGPGRVEPVRSAGRGGTRSAAGGRTAGSPGPSRRAPRSRSAHRRGTAAPAGSRAPGWPYAPPAAPGRPAPRTSATSPSAHIRSTRSAIRSSSSGGVQVDAELHRRVVRRRLGQRRGERRAGQLDHLQRPDDPPAVAGQDAGRRGRVRRAQPRVQRRGADRGQLRLQPRPHRRVGAGELELAPAPPARTGPEPPTSSGTRPRARMSSTAARASRWYSATLAGSVTSQMSSRWCGTPSRSAGVSLAVPMSMPR